MVETSKSLGQDFIDSIGCTTTLMEYLPPAEQLQKQAVCKRWYETNIPRALDKVSLPSINLILEDSRKNFYICRWSENENLDYWPILKISDEPGPHNVDKDKLGFSEIYFQYWQMLTEFDHIVFPMEQEAYLK